MADPDDVASSSGRSVPFVGHVGRGSVDWFFHNAHTEQVVLNQQADFKASVVITASAVILSIAAVQIDNDPMGIAAGVLVGLLLIALLAGVIAVLPKFRLHPEPGDRLPDHWNPMFFGAYVRIPKERYLQEIDRILRSDDEVYRAIAVELYDKGRFLVQGKYRYLRISYLAFIAAFFAAAVTYALVSIVD